MTGTNHQEPGTDEALEAVVARGAVLVVTDDSEDSGLAAARRTAGAVAARGGVPVVLYDRSEETWGDTPHPDGPLDRHDRRLAERPHLVAQMDELRNRGVKTQAWVATLPSISAVDQAISATSADVVVVAEEMSTRLLERALAGADSLADIVLGSDLAELILAQADPRLDQEITVVAVSADDQARVVGRG